MVIGLHLFSRFRNTWPIALCPTSFMAFYEAIVCGQEVIGLIHSPMFLLLGVVYGLFNRVSDWRSQWVNRSRPRAIFRLPRNIQGGPKMFAFPLQTLSPSAQRGLDRLCVCVCLCVSFDRMRARLECSIHVSCGQVGKASQRSEKTRKKMPRKMSSDSSSTRDTHHHRSSGRRAILKRKRGHSRSRDSNDRPHQSRKRQALRYGDEVRHRRNVKKRRKEVRHRVSASKRRYRSMNISSTSSDSSSSYSSQSCSTCSSYSSSSVSSGGRLEKTHKRSKKGLTRSAYCNEGKQRVTSMELEKQYAKNLDVPGFRNPKGKVCMRDGKLSACRNADYSLELNKLRKRRRNLKEESNGLSVHAESRKQLGTNDSYNEERLLGKTFSCLEKSKEEGQVPVDAKLKAEALEFLLRQKALENLKRFRNCKFAVAGAPSPKKVEPLACLGSREDDRVVFSGRFEGNKKFGKDEVDRASNKHLEDNARDYEQPVEASTERENNSAYLDKTTFIEREFTKHSEDGRRDHEESMEALSKKGKDKAYREMNLVRIKSSCLEETCMSSIATSQRAATSDLCADYSDVNATCSGLKVDASETCIAEIRRKSSQYEGDKSAAVIDKGSKVDFISLNKEHAWKNEMSGSEKPTVEKSDDCALETELVSDKSAPKVSELALTKNQNFQAGIVKADEESTEDTKPVTSRKSDDSPTKRCENSSFQQKTMSVMRGGEMVQVSYKVYIPQRVATLSKRQLQR